MYLQSIILRVELTYWESNAMYMNLLYFYYHQVGQTLFLHTLCPLQILFLHWKDMRTIQFKLTQHLTPLGYYLKTDCMLSHLRGFSHSVTDIYSILHLHTLQVYIGRITIAAAKKLWERVVSILLCSPFSQKTCLNWTSKMQSFLQISKFCLILQFQCTFFMLTVCDKIQELIPRSILARLKHSFFNCSKNVLLY